MLNTPELVTTPRLILRRPRLSDAAAIFEYGRDPVVIHYMDYPPRTHISEVEKSLEQHLARWNTADFSWVITIKPDDRPIGTIACSIENHAAEFGYLLNQKAWGMGYATEAATAIVQWAMSLPDVHRIWATCDTENLASARVLEKCGLTCEERLHAHRIRPNISPHPRDAFLYALHCPGASHTLSRTQTN